MHSSRIRTARRGLCPGGSLSLSGKALSRGSLGGLCPGGLCRGEVSIQRGLCLGGGLCPVGHPDIDPPPPVNRMTDRQV